MKIDDYNNIYTCDFEENGVTYKWSGGFGAVIKSQERGLKVGDLRKIGGAIMKVFMIYPPCRMFNASEICWTTEEEVSMGWIREYKKKVFRC